MPRPIQKWEYLVETSKVKETTNGSHHDQAEIAHLNNLGQQGWELVTLCRMAFEFEHRVFKRPLYD